MGSVFDDDFLDFECEKKPRCKFKVGELVRLRRGEKPQKVIEISESGTLLKATYSGRDAIDYPPRWRSVTDYVKYNGEEPFEQETEEMAKLYEINENGNVLFGTLLAQNSVGKFVLEIKGTGEVRAFDPKEVTEVVPYTVQVQIVGATGTKSEVHYRAVKDTLVVGDYLLFSDGSFGVVKRIDTKHPNAQSLKKARKIVTEAIGDVE